MRAALVEQPDPAMGVAEQNQVLAQELDPDRWTIRFRDLVRKCRRYPIAPHQLAHGRSRPDTGEVFHCPFAKASEILPGFL